MSDIIHFESTCSKKQSDLSPDHLDSTFCSTVLTQGSPEVTQKAGSEVTILKVSVLGILERRLRNHISEKFSEYTDTAAKCHQNCSQ